MYACEADLSVDAGGETEIWVRFSDVTSSCRVWLMSRSWAAVQLRSTEPSSSSASACCSSCWICCSRRRLRSLRSASLCCSSAISSCTGFGITHERCFIILIQQCWVLAFGLISMCLMWRWIKAQRDETLKECLSIFHVWSSLSQ